jgi:hypothetical protein
MFLAEVGAKINIFFRINVFNHFKKFLNNFFKVRSRCDVINFLNFDEISLKMLKKSQKSAFEHFRFDNLICR